MPEHHIHIVGVGDKTEMKSSDSDDLPCNVDFIVTEAKSQYDDLLRAEQESKADLYVLCQLTQPVREKGLLLRTVQLFEKNHRTIISGTKLPDNRWRVLNEDGVWESKTDSRAVYHDGVIYAWEGGKLKEIYERETPHDVIVSSEFLPLIDIDYKEDMP